MQTASVALADLDRVLKSFAGRTTLIHHFATWCDPCVEEMPELARILQSLSPREFHAIAISWELFMSPVEPAEAERACADFLEEMNAPFDALFVYTGDPNDLFRAMRVSTGTVPFTEVRDERGVRIAEFPRPIVEPFDQEQLVAALHPRHREPR